LELAAFHRFAEDIAMFRRCVLGAGWLLLAGLTLPAGADEPAANIELPAPEIAVGQPVLAIEGTDDAGQPWRSADHFGQKVIVLYFYPGDFTGGCIKQAEAFRAGLAMLSDAGVEVVGVSGDSVATHKLFKETYGLKHTLLSDPEGALAKQLGVPVTEKPAKVRTRGPDGKPLMDEKGKSIILERSVTLSRWTLIIGRDGKLAAKRTTVTPTAEADEVLKIVQGLER
jgi:peroxiredoxin Q/BCP